MRGSIPEYFPPAPGLPGDPEAYLQVVENTYVTDAFHSVSIEGYQVSLQLIKRVRSGTWNPEANEADKNMRHTLAARGYWRAFQKVKESLTNIIEGGNARVIIDEDHGGLYREMFASGATAALVKACDLAGYRNVPVYIRRSRHVPLNRDAVRDAVPAFSERLAQETEPSAHVVLGHFVFLQFLLYRDGFFRICQFLKNVMLTAGGVSLDGHPSGIARRSRGCPRACLLGSGHHSLCTIYRQTRQRRTGRQRRRQLLPVRSRG